MADGVGRRVGWIDAGRGVAIVLVVLYHSARWLDAPGWEFVNGFVASLRMPFFFALSGILAHRVAQTPWPELWRRRISLYVWVFSVWEVVGTVSYQVGFAIRGTRLGLRGSVVDLVLAPVMPMFELWFIWALAIFCILVRLLQRVDWRIQLVVAAIPAVVALTPSFDLGNLGWNGVLKYYFFFVLGTGGRRWLLALAERPLLLRVALLGAWLLAAGLLAHSSVIDVPGPYFVLCVLGVVAGISLSSFLGGWGRLRALGSNTLPVYVGHTPVIILVSSVLIAALGSDAVQAANPVLVPVLGIAAAAAALGLHRGVQGTRGELLYAAPTVVACGTRGPRAGDAPPRTRGASDSPQPSARPASGSDSARARTSDEQSPDLGH